MEPLEINLYEVHFKLRSVANKYINDNDIEVLRYEILPKDQSVMITYRLKGND